MKYILDFDDTIFDAVRFKTILAECGISEDTVSSETFAEIKKHKPHFDPASLIFPDALQFLREHKNDCEIVSTYLSRENSKNTNIEARKKFQTEKIALCGITALLGSFHVHLVGQSKEPILQQLLGQFQSQGQEYVYIDDRKEYVETAEKLGIPAYRMERIATGSFESFGAIEKPGVISSFARFRERYKSDREGTVHHE